MDSLVAGDQAAGPVAGARRVGRPRLRVSRVPAAAAPSLRSELPPRWSGPQRTGGPPLADLLSRCSFPSSGTDVHCAVSGGADSLALLLLAVAAGCRVSAIHVDHGLR